MHTDSSEQHDELITNGCVHMLQSGIVKAPTDDYKDIFKYYIPQGSS